MQQLFWNAGTDEKPGIFFTCPKAGFYCIMHPLMNCKGPGREWKNSSIGSDGKGEWSEMVRACVKEGWWPCFEEGVGTWSEGKEEARTTGEDMEITSGEGE